MNATHPLAIDIPKKLEAPTAEHVGLRNIIGKEAGDSYLVPVCRQRPRDLTLQTKPRTLGGIELRFQKHIKVNGVTVRKISPIIRSFLS
jgi:hypothetical protein